MELVYAVEASRLPPPSGRVLPLSEALWERINREGAFYPRERVEEDERYRQPIPYAVLVYEGKVWRMKRKPKGGEKRLVGRQSIGVGGHVNPEDLCREPVTWALYRELFEEAGVRARRVRRLGLILTDATPVERVHVGVLYLVEPDQKPVAQEAEKLSGELVPLAQVEAEAERLEGWSRVALEALRGINLYSV